MGNALKSNVIMFAVGEASELEPDERRNSPRRRVLKAAKVAYQDRYCVVECTVRDLSETGARLRTSNSVSVPDTFELILDTEGLEAHCEVMWRHDRDVGVRFVGAPRRVVPARRQVVQADQPAKKPSLLKRPIKAD